MWIIRGISYPSRSTIPLTMVGGRKLKLQALKVASQTTHGHSRISLPYEKVF